MINNTSDVSVVGGILRVDEGIDKRVYIFMGCPLTKSKPLKEKNSRRKEYLCQYWSFSGDDNGRRDKDCRKKVAGMIVIL